MPRCGVVLVFRFEKIEDFPDVGMWSTGEPHSGCPSVANERLWAGQLSMFPALFLCPGHEWILVCFFAAYPQVNVVVLR